MINKTHNIFRKLFIIIGLLIILQPACFIYSQTKSIVIQDTVTISPRRTHTLTPKAPPGWGFMVPLITLNDNPFQGNPDKYMEIYLSAGNTPLVGFTQDHYPSMVFYQLPDPVIRWYFNGVEVPEKTGAMSFEINTANYWPIVLAQDTVSVSLRVTAENAYGFAEAKGVLLMGREKLLSHFSVWADRDTVRHGDTLHVYAQAMEIIGDVEQAIVYPSNTQLTCYLSSAGQRLGSFLLADSSKVKEITDALYGQLKIENGGILYVADGETPANGSEPIDIGVVKVGFRPKGGLTTVTVKGSDEQLCPIVSISPSTIKAGETAEVTIKQNKSDGTLVDFSAGTLFDLEITSDDWQQIGELSNGIDPNGKKLSNTTVPVTFKANADIMNEITVTILGQPSSGIPGGCGIPTATLTIVDGCNSVPPSAPRCSGVANDPELTVTAQPNGFGGQISHACDDGKTLGFFVPMLFNNPNAFQPPQIAVCYDEASRGWKVSFPSITINSIVDLCDNNVTGFGKILVWTLDSLARDEICDNSKLEKDLLGHYSYPLPYDLRYHFGSVLMLHEKSHQWDYENRMASFKTGLNKQLNDIKIRCKNAQSAQQAEQTADKEVRRAIRNFLATVNDDWNKYIGLKDSPQMKEMEQRNHKKVKFYIDYLHNQLTSIKKTSNCQ